MGKKAAIERPTQLKQVLEDMLAVVQLFQETQSLQQQRERLQGEIDEHALLREDLEKMRQEKEGLAGEIEKERGLLSEGLAEAQARLEEAESKRAEVLESIEAASSQHRDEMLSDKESLRSREEEVLWRERACVQAESELKDKESALDEERAAFEEMRAEFSLHVKHTMSALGAESKE